MADHDSDDPLAFTSDDGIEPDLTLVDDGHVEQLLASVSAEHRALTASEEGEEGPTAVDVDTGPVDVEAETREVDTGPVDVEAETREVDTGPVDAGEERHAFAEDELPAVGAVSASVVWFDDEPTASEHPAETQWGEEEPTATTAVGGVGPPTRGALPRHGDVLAGYVIGDVAHETATSRVFQAEHSESGEAADIELLLPAFAGKPDAVQRFLHLGHRMKRLSHPHLVAILDVVEWPNGTGCWVREPVHGVDLKSLLKRDELPSLHRVIRIGAQVCGALQTAHDAGIVHRDVKPANIILNRLGAEPGAAKLTGFGAVDLLGSEGTDVLDATSIGQILGTPSYMAPEQLGGFKIDFRVDLYALGLVLYELVTGEEAFRGESVSVVLDKVASEIPRPASAVAPFGREVPPQLDELIAECLIKAPAMRPPSAAEVADRLTMLARPGPRRSSMPTPRMTPRNIRADAAAIRSTERATGRRSTRRPTQKEASPLLLAGIGFLVAIVVGLAIIGLLAWTGG